MIEILFQLLTQNLRAAAAPPIDAALGGGSDAESEPSAFEALLASTLATLEGASPLPVAPAPTADRLDAAAAIDALAAEKKGVPAGAQSPLAALLAEAAGVEIPTAAPTASVEPAVANATVVATAPEAAAAALAAPVATPLAQKLERRPDARTDDAPRPPRDDAPAPRSDAEIGATEIETPEIALPPDTVRSPSANDEGPQLDLADAAGDAAAPPLDPNAGDADSRSASERPGGRELPSFARTDAASFREVAARIESPRAETSAGAAVASATSDADAAAADPAEPILTPPALSIERAAPPTESRPAPVVQANGPPNEAVADRIEWLAERGGGTARVKLTPPSLGEIEIEVRMRNGVAEVSVRARESATTGLLAGERMAVTHILASRDLRMDDFQVVHEPLPRAEMAAGTGGEQSPRESFGEAQQRQERGGGDAERRPQQPFDPRAPLSAPIARASANAPLPNHARLDLRI